MNHENNISDKCTFELLSAYLDGEVTASERQEVQKWLAEDPEVQQLYSRLQLLRDKFKTFPTPEPEYSAQDITNNVFAAIDEKQKTRKRWLWGGGAIAALVVATVGSIFSESNSPMLQFAQQEKTEALMIALNKPIIDIPSESEALMIPLNQSIIDMPEETEATESESLKISINHSLL